LGSLGWGWLGLPWDGVFALCWLGLGLGLDWLGLASAGLDWACFAWLGLAWLGLDWLGLGLDWQYLFIYGPFNYAVNSSHYRV
jgi:hypothetical protein